MQGRDGRLDRIGVGRMGAQLFVQQTQPFGNLALVPERPVLLLQHHEITLRGYPGGAA